MNKTAFVIKRLEGLLWFSGCEHFPGPLRNGPLARKDKWEVPSQGCRRKETNICEFRLATKKGSEKNDNDAENIDGVHDDDIDDDDDEIHNDDDDDHDDNDDDDKNDE